MNHLKSNIVDDTSDEEDNEVFVNVKKFQEEQYSDYYECIENSKSIRPICLTEDVEFKKMSSVRKCFWWIGTFFKVLSFLVDLFLNKGSHVILFTNIKVSLTKICFDLVFSSVKIS